MTRGLIGRAGIVGRIVLLAVVAGLLGGALVVPAVGAVGLVTRNTADKFNNMKTGALGELPVRSEILDSRGRLLAYFYPRGIDREPVSFNQISPIMRKAIVAIEDSRFYQHGAIDIRGTVRALVNDIEHKQVQGGSTLTQQYVKNALILTAPNTQMAEQATSETLSRKLKELRLAIGVERKLTKDQILAGYLNAAFFGTFYGNQAVGVGAAAERYFDTTAAQLTLPEAAMLAGMVENPSLDNPVTNPAAAIKRRNVVLARMAQLKIISQARAVAVGKQGLGLHLSPLQTGCTSGSAKPAAFFCDYVVSLLKQDNAFSQAWNVLNTSGGLQIYTTLSAQDEHAAKRGGELHGAAAAQRGQPGRERRVRGADPARLRAHHGHRQRPLLRHREEPDHRGLRGELPVRRRGRGADRLLVEAVHPGHRPGAGRAVRFPADRPGGHDADRVHQLQGSSRPAPPGT